MLVLATMHSPVFQATFCLDGETSPATLREVEHAANITIAVIRHIICKRERLMCCYSGVWDVVNLFIILLFASLLGILAPTAEGIALLYRDFGFGDGGAKYHSFRSEDLTVQHVGQRVAICCKRSGHSYIMHRHGLGHFAPSAEGVTLLSGCFRQSDGASTGQCLCIELQEYLFLQESMAMR